MSLQCPKQKMKLLSISFWPPNTDSEKYIIPWVSHFSFLLFKNVKTEYFNEKIIL